jgi:hypothetical protein
MAWRSAKDPLLSPAPRVQAVFVSDWVSGREPGAVCYAAAWCACWASSRRFGQVVRERKRGKGRPVFACDYSGPPQALPLSEVGVYVLLS